ncbi:mechanosensitive ion channel [Lyngbya confervoides]|uniref:Mechanosensitive ion channel n=1 Tax=Lyngbya confervoides BDU141951 TaxID=1574623 RepID=A0ABD4T9Z8_9CYAN|nr:mechanosensitive ion channel [Lyngbya confervoides]MCM1985381.1 mechanosensitive ion channel [Lyngbya confervoides BDU141951]
MNSLVESVSNQFGTSLGSNVLNIISAVAILVIGLIVAFVVAKTVRNILARTEVDQKLARWVTGDNNPTVVSNIEQWVETAVFWILMLFVLVGFLQALQLSGVSEPLNELLKQIFNYLPKIGGALLLLGLAWVLATIAKMLVVRGLKAFAIDERVNSSTSPSGSSAPLAISDTVGNAVYWFIFLLFLPAILGALSLSGPLEPIQVLLNEILATLPNILGAVIYGVIGWFLAKIVRTVVTNLLSAVGADQFGERFGVGRATGGRGLSWLLGTFAFVAILVPVAIAVLNSLQLDAVSGPASNMLNQIFAAGPRILAAVLILAFAYIIGKFVCDLVTNILTSVGFNNIFEWLGLQAASPAREEPTTPPTVDPRSTVLQVAPTGEPTVPRKTPSEMVGIISLVGLLILSLVPATDALGFAPLTTIVTELLQILAQVLVGTVIFGIGLYLANLAFTILSSSGGAQARLVGQAARIAIIVLVAAMALQQMGIAPSIVNLAFGLLVGAVAVALAVAFGFGGIDIASEQIRAWLADFKSKDS